MPTYPTNIDVDLVCTHADLTQELGSDNQLRLIGLPVPNDPADWSKPIRSAVLREVLRSLERRRPPIRYEMLGNPAQLNIAVVYGTLARIFRNQMVSSGDRFHTLSNQYQAMYASEMKSLQVDIQSSATVSTFGVRISRS